MSSSATMQVPIRTTIPARLDQPLTAVAGNQDAVGTRTALSDPALEATNGHLGTSA
jgi:hypothetical protein